jgi:hypothetical protein
MASAERPASSITEPTVSRFHWVVLATGVLPIASVHLTYLVAASQGHVPWCFPYIDSCSSISATGRHGAGFYLFKATMIPAALLLMLFWGLARSWLRQLADKSRYPDSIVVLGIIGALFLIVYTVALGASGDVMRLQRRIGIIIYFSFTFLAQFLLIYRLQKGITNNPLVPYIRRLCYFTLSVGIGSLVVDALVDNYSDYEDAFEWVLALLVHCYFLMLWCLWRNAEYIARARTE